MKVYGGLKFKGGKQLRCIVAAMNMKEVAAIANESLYGIRQYWCETGNAAELEAAHKQPGVLLWGKDSMGGGKAEDYQPLDK